MTGRRNSKVGYCQGLNGLVAYFLQKDIQEEVVLGHIGMFLDSSLHHRRVDAERILQ